MLPNRPKYVANSVKYVANWLSRLVTFAPTSHYQIKLSTLVFITYASPMLAGLFPVCHIFIAEYRARFLFDVFARSISIPPRARSLYGETEHSVTH
jgi:hypothetical protein